MKKLSPKTTVERQLQDHRDCPVFVHYYTDDKSDYQRFRVVVYSLDHETRTKSQFDRLVKQGKLIASSTWGKDEHYGPYILADLDYVSAAIAALRQYIADYTDRLERDKQDRRDYLAGIGDNWRPDIASYDWLKSMIDNETAIQFAERELVFFLYLKSQGIRTFDPEYGNRRDQYGRPAYSEMRNGSKHLYRKGQ